jgi:serine phosphatase RsbU (regulator of sigma subunit)
VAKVIRTGRPQIYTDIPPDALAAYARDDEHLQLLNAIGATAVIIVPMIGAKTVGAITLVSAESLRRLSSVDLALAERLARRSGTAVERARLYTERSRIANILERSLLPESLPEVPGVEIQARYSPAGEVNEVGGDFYDVFPYEAPHGAGEDPSSAGGMQSSGTSGVGGDITREGPTAGSRRWMLAIGDVCGKGPRAAGITALARHTLRAAALSGQTPTQMLGTLHRALRLQPTGGDMCTVCLVLLEPVEPVEPTGDGERPGGENANATDVSRAHALRARLTVALAGHLPPLLINADGSVRELGEPGTLLGVVEPIEIHERTAEIHSGQTLLLYTDGVPEAGRADAQLGEHGLFELCAATPQLTLSGLLEHIERGTREHATGRLRDDIALLGLRL